MKRVAIIGGGAAGLCMARHFAAHPKMFQPIIYEETSSVGGTWTYEDKSVNDPIVQVVQVNSKGNSTQKTDNSFHSSMYKGLRYKNDLLVFNSKSFIDYVKESYPSELNVEKASRTNLPKEVMEFPDFPFKSSLPSFLRHQEVLHYIEDYAKHFDLYKFIRFGTQVTNVLPKQKSNQGRFVSWEVTVQNISDKNVTSEVFDAVIVCNGHYTVPYIPDIPGMSSFPGIVTHSHWYKHPNQYQGKNVVILGAASSGRDIAVEVSTVADKVILSHKNPPLPTELPSNIIEKLPIKEVDSLGHIVFGDGTTTETDIIVICTGYLYDFPFLAAECEIKVQNERVFPLYKHLFNIKYPSMAFIGLSKVVIPFPLFHLQAHYVANILSGKETLPSQSEMETDTNNEFEERQNSGQSEKHYHILGERMWRYFDTISALSSCDPIPSVIQRLYDEVKYHRNTNLLHYREANFSIVNEEEFVELEPKLKTKDRQKTSDQGFY